MIQPYLTETIEANHLVTHVLLSAGLLQKPVAAYFSAAEATA